MKLTLRDLAAPLFRRKRVLISTFLFAFVLAALFGWLRLHKYESHMVILVSHGLLDLQAEAMIPTDQEVDKEARLIKSRDLLQQVVVASGMQNTRERSYFLYPWQRRTDRVTLAVRSLAARIDVQIPPKASLIGVTFSSSDPDLAYGVLNSLGGLYIRDHAALQRGPGENYKAALQDADAGLRAIGLSQGIVDPREQRTMQAITAEAQQIRSIREQYDFSDLLVPQADQQKGRAKAAAANQTGPAFELSPQNPAPVLGGQRGAVENTKAQVIKIEKPSLDEAGLEREAKDDEQNYLLYLSRREKERTSGALGKTPIVNVAILVPPAKATLPMHGLASILLGALALAILASFSITYITDRFDPSFHTPAQVMDILGIPVVVAVPKRTA